MSYVNSLANKLGPFNTFCLAAGLVISGIGAKDAFNAYSERSTLKDNGAIAAARACEIKLALSQACSLDEQKALLSVKNNRIASEDAYGRIVLGVALTVPIGRF